MGWIEKLSQSPKKGQKRRNLPSLDLRGARSLFDLNGRRSSQDEELPNASIIYGMGAGGLIACALYSFVMGSWFTGLFLLVPAAALIGFALHFIKHHP